MSKKARLSIHLTERALTDIARIKTWSIEQFGRAATNAYLRKFEQALHRIKETPEVLRSEPIFHDSLKFYRMEKHLLVCETAITNRIIILTVVHGSIDVFNRLAELEPTLNLEAKILLEKLTKQA